MYGLERGMSLCFRDRTQFLLYLGCELVAYINVKMVSKDQKPTSYPINQLKKKKINKI